MSTSYPEAIREGTAAAARLHQRLGTQGRLAGKGGSIDVLATALELDVTLLFRPLKGLLGAYLPMPRPGILVTTERPLSIQRFTAAHEVGHLVMKHQPSLDDEGVLRRGMFTPDSEGNDFQEVEANAFAAAFLMPLWMVAEHCGRHGWTGAELQRPQNIYQLSLRLGVSYEAVCWTLGRNRLVPMETARDLANIAPRTLKAELLGDVRPKDYRGDVWLLTERDEGQRLTGSPNDHFVMRLGEHSGGGYLWDFGELERRGFVVLRNGHTQHDAEGIGGHGVREVVAHAADGFEPVLRLIERRPWLPAQALNTLELGFDLSGPESNGFSRAERRRLLEAA